jgi:galactokinase
MNLTNDHGPDGGRHRVQGSNESPPAAIWATGPGRVNLIGDHTDYNLGLALPMAIQMGVTVRFTPDPPDALDGNRSITVTSDARDGRAVVPFDLPPDPSVVAEIDPPWARLVAAVIALARPASGGALQVTSTLPVGSGLSSSAALAVALAEVLGVDGPPETIARVCQAAEHLTGVPVGIMDPLCCAGARCGHALLIDFASVSTRPVPLPDDLQVVVVHSGISRTLTSSPYVSRVAECEAAAEVVGPLGAIDDADLVGLRDPILRRRARHVLTECRRVREFAEALTAEDLVTAGLLMAESHRSLAEDFDVSTPELDALVADIGRRPGVYGARLTGAGFGGCVVALAQPGALDPGSFPTPAWDVVASDGTVAGRGSGVPGFQ